MTQPFGLLSSVELRVLATLCEKQRTVPDTYPLSLNALVAGCNQKTSRNPVMELTEAQALDALESLKDKRLVAEVSGGRVLRFTQHLDRALAIPGQAVALLVVLMLRGPQTAGELRLNADRLHTFADISAVEAFLVEMAERPAGALVRELPKAPGSRENRWTHLLGEMAVGEASTAGGGDSAAMAAVAAARDEEIEQLKARVGALETAWAELMETLKAGNLPPAGEA